MINKEKLTEENKKELEKIYGYISTVLGIETLEYYDKNYLSGDNESRSRNKIELLKLALDILK